MKILIVKTSSLGDIIHAFPVLQYLRKLHPKAQIDWVVEKPFVELVQAHPDINHVWSISSKKWRKNLFKADSWKEIRKFVKELRTHSYDLVFDLQGNIKSGLIVASTKGVSKVGFGRATVPEWPNLLFTNRKFNPPSGNNIREDYLFLAQSQCNDFNGDCGGVRLKINSEEKSKIDAILSHPNLKDGKKVMVCVGSNWTNKQLPKETLKPVLEQLNRELNVRFLFIWGTAEEKATVEELQADLPNCSIVVDKLGLASLQNLMAELDLVISMDSLPLHLAGTTSTPTFSTFGASLGSKYKPIGSRHEAFQGACPYGRVFEKRCPILRTCKTGYCIKNIEEDVLVGKLRKILDIKE